MKFTQLLYFKTVVETGTIAQAARQLYISAPALSIAIGNLEKELGVDLFVHTSNRVILTERGEIYYRRVVKILKDLSDASEEVSRTETYVFGGGPPPCPVPMMSHTFGICNDPVFVG